MPTDTELLDWIADNGIIEGLGSVMDDIFERACNLATAAGEEPETVEQWTPWHRKALREIIAEAMKELTA